MTDVEIRAHPTLLHVPPSAHETLLPSRICACGHGGRRREGEGRPGQSANSMAPRREATSSWIAFDRGLRQATRKQQYPGLG